MLTKQEIFNKAYEGLRSQHFHKSEGAVDTFCMYRGPDGMKCAIGHLISDENYSVDLENKRVRNKMVRKAAEIPDHIDERFLQELQDCHDCSWDSLTMEGNLIRFAMRYNLRIPE